jgi:hypothetical protein
MKELRDLYILYYKDRLATKLTKTFYHPGGLEKAMQRAITHCGQMQFRFIRVEPMFADLDDDELVRLYPNGAPHQTPKEAISIR